VDIHLKGFTMEEVKDIIGYIRSVEAHRESRFVFVNIGDPDDNAEKALNEIRYLWPEKEGPPFLWVFKREKTEE